MHEDADGTLWIGSAWSGLNRLKDGLLTAIRPEDGLTEGRAQVILEDRAGGLWLTGNKGFQRLRKPELVAAAAGRRGALRPLSFGLADGLRSASFASGQQPAGSIGPDGRLWLPSYRGVVVVDPERIPPPPPPPGVRLEEVLVDGVSQRPGDRLEYGPGRRSVEIRYAATTLQPPELIRFRFRLEGFDGSWIDVESRRSAYYTGLPPGRYIFRAASRIGDGEWGPETQLLSLSVRPAVHQTGWFRALAALLAGALVLSGVRLRTLQLRRRQAELERLVADRTEELRRANERLSELSFSDALTGLSNRRRFDEALEAEWSRGMRFGRPLSLVMADIDHFKKYNDALGHPAGDWCLGEVARVLQSVARRTTDLVARYGGEEFVLLLPATDADAAVATASRARADLEALGIPHPDGPTPFVTASFGVATILPRPGLDRHRLIAASDDALYRAKNAGRNRVEVASAPEPGAGPAEGGGSPPGDLIED